MNKKILMALLAISSFIMMTGVQAALVIDDFTDYQTVTDFGGGSSTSVIPLSLTGSGITNITRTITATSIGSAVANETILIGNDLQGPGTGGLLSVENNSFSTGSVSILWNFPALDLAFYGNSFLLEVNFIDLNVQMEMIVNGTSSSGSQNFTGSGNFYIDFQNFTDPTIFTSVDSLELKLSGPAGWDGQFKLLGAYNVPEPTPLALIGMSLAVLSLSRRVT